MSQEHFDVGEFAEYLHLTPSQVIRLAERGKAPGRKVAGEWRFSQSEVHLWLEERIGLSDEEELAEVEDVLERSRQARNESQASLADMLHLEAIAIPMSARTRSKVIGEMVGLAARTGLLWDPPRMEDAVRARENLHPTALDNGVAFLHPRRPMQSILAEPILALGRSSTGIPFGGEGGGGLTDVFFLICSTDDSVHLRTLARLSRLVGDNSALAALRDAQTPQEAHQVLLDFEEEAFE